MRLESSHLLRGCLGLTLLIAPLFAQNVGVPVTQTDWSGPDPVVHQYFYDGSSNLIYECRALQNITFPPNTNTGNPGFFSIALGTLTNISVAGGTGTINFPSTSFLWIGAQVTVSGSATATLNATYKVTAVSGTTATITTTAPNATYTDAGLVMTTLQPLLNQPVWTIHAFVYSGTTLQGSYWAAGVSQGGRLACSNRANF